jgi:MoxR-like ATPase
MNNQSVLLLNAAVNEISRAVFGKQKEIKQALSCLLAGGHLLIEDLPGMGKTTLAQSLAKVLGLSFSRVQFTSDMLPADILGVSIYDQNSGSFQFHEGPVFTELLLADELNRATPKTQSALLEAMAERQVSIEGMTRPLPEVFFVIATQNPSSQSGTYPLPESQLDRFLMRIQLGYPDPASERQILEGKVQVSPLVLKPILHAQQLMALRQVVQEVSVSASLMDYLQRVIAFTRHSSEFQHGLSTRGAQALLQAAKAWALIEGRDYVLPDDLQAVLEPVVEHRLQGVGQQVQAVNLSSILLKQVDVLA